MIPMDRNKLFIAGVAAAAILKMASARDYVAATIDHMQSAIDSMNGASESIKGAKVAEGERIAAEERIAAAAATEEAARMAAEIAEHEVEQRRRADQDATDKEAEAAANRKREADAAAAKKQAEEDAAAAEAERIRKEKEAAASIKQAKTETYASYKASCTKLGVPCVAFDESATLNHWTGLGESLLTAESQADANASTILVNAANAGLTFEPVYSEVKIIKLPGQIAMQELIVASKYPCQYHTELVARKARLASNGKDLKTNKSNLERVQASYSVLTVSGTKAVSADLAPTIGNRFDWFVGDSASLNMLRHKLSVGGWEKAQVSPKVLDGKKDLEMRIKELEWEITKLVDMVSQDKIQINGLAKIVPEKRAAIITITREAMDMKKDKVIFNKYPAGTTDWKSVTFVGLVGRDIDFIRWLKTYYHDVWLIYVDNLNEKVKLLTEYKGRLVMYWKLRLAAENPRVTTVMAAEAEEKAMASITLIKGYPADNIRSAIKTVNVGIANYRRLATMSKEAVWAEKQATLAVRRAADQRSALRHKQFHMAKMLYTYEWLATGEAYRNLTRSIRGTMLGYLKNPERHSVQSFMSRATKNEDRITELTSGQYVRATQSGLDMHKWSIEGSRLFKETFPAGSTWGANIGVTAAKATEVAAKKTDAVRALTKRLSLSTFVATAKEAIASVTLGRTVTPSAAPKPVADPRIPILITEIRRMLTAMGWKPADIDYVSGTLEGKSYGEVLFAYDGHQKKYKAYRAAPSLIAKAAEVQLLPAAIAHSFRWTYDVTNPNDPNDHIVFMTGETGSGRRADLSTLEKYEQKQAVYAGESHWYGVTGKADNYQLTIRQLTAIPERLDVKIWMHLHDRQDLRELEVYNIFDQSIGPVTGAIGSEWKTKLKQVAPPIKLPGNVRAFFILDVWDQKTSTLVAHDVSPWFLMASGY